MGTGTSGAAALESTYNDLQTELQAIMAEALEDGVIDDAEKAAIDRVRDKLRQIEDLLAQSYAADSELEDEEEDLQMSIGGAAGGADDGLEGGWTDSLKDWLGPGRGDTPPGGETPEEPGGGFFPPGGDSPAEPGGDPSQGQPTEPGPEAGQPTLRKGDEDPDGWVEYLQGLLRNHNAPSLQVTGVFDQATHDAVIQFQSMPREPMALVDGVVGNETWSLLRKNPERAAVGTDGRDPHSHSEQGAEARWMVESSETAVYVEGSDTLELIAATVGTESIEGMKVQIKLNGAATTAEFGPQRTHRPVGIGHMVVLKEVSKIASGEVAVEAIMPGPLGGDRWNGTITVPPNTFGTAMLQVNVKDTDGLPVGGAAVTLTDGPTRVPPATTDNLGRASFDELAEGSYKLNATLGDITWDTVTLRDGELVNDLIIEKTLDRPNGEVPNGHLEVTVEDQSGSPVPGARVQITAGPTRRDPLVTGPDGIAHFDGLATGDYTVTATLGNVTWAPETTDVVTPLVSNVDLDEPSGPVTQPNEEQPTGGGGGSGGGETGDGTGEETPPPARSDISAPVGRGGRNVPEDVTTVQTLLNEQGNSLTVDGLIGPATIGAISRFQEANLGFADGRVDPGGQTWGALTGGGGAEPETPPSEPASDQGGSSSGGGDSGAAPSRGATASDPDTSGIEVTVLGTDGAPERGVTVTLSLGAREVARQTTAPNGTANFTGVAPDNYTLNASNRDMEWEPVEIAENRLEPGESISALMNMPILPDTGGGAQSQNQRSEPAPSDATPPSDAPATEEAPAAPQKERDVIVTVLRKTDKAPLDGLVVTIDPAPPSSYPYQTTGRDGKVTFTGLPEPSYTLKTEEDGVTVEETVRFGTRDAERVTLLVDVEVPPVEAGERRTTYGPDGVPSEQEAPDGEKLPTLNDRISSDVRRGLNSVLVTTSVRPAADGSAIYKVEAVANLNSARVADLVGIERPEGAVGASELLGHLSSSRVRERETGRMKTPSGKPLEYALVYTVDG